MTSNNINKNDLHESSNKSLGLTRLQDLLYLFSWTYTDACEILHYAHLQSISQMKRKYLFELPEVKQKILADHFNISVNDMIKLNIGDWAEYARSSKSLNEIIEKN